MAAGVRDTTNGCLPCKSSYRDGVNRPAWGCCSISKSIGARLSAEGVCWINKEGVENMEKKREVNGAVNSSTFFFSLACCSSHGQPNHGRVAVRSMKELTGRSAVAAELTVLSVEGVVSVCLPKVWCEVLV